MSEKESFCHCGHSWKWHKIIGIDTRGKCQHPLIGKATVIVCGCDGFSYDRHVEKEFVIGLFDKKECSANTWIKEFSYVEDDYDDENDDDDCNEDE